MKRSKRIATLAAALALVGSTGALAIDPVVDQSSMFGVHGSSGRLYRYDFGSSTLNDIGSVVNVEGGATLTGVMAAGYFNGFQQLHAFWNDPADGHSKVIHIDTETGEAKLTGVDLGEGAIQGAVAFKSASSWKVFAVQDHVEPVTPPALGGMLNINPSNSPHYEFTMKTVDGRTITRDNLHLNAAVDGQGVLFHGGVTSILVKPKGNGNQNGLLLNGEYYAANNSSTFLFEGSNMTVKLFNDHIKNAKAMGHWWLGTDAQTATVTINGAVVVSPPDPWVPTSKLVSLHTETGLATTVQELKRAYTGLASQNGTTFYGVSGGNLYRIDTASDTETLVGTVAAYNFTELEFVGTTLMGFDSASDTLVPINPTTGLALGSGANLGLADLDTIVFLPTSGVQARSKLSFD